MSKFERFVITASTWFFGAVCITVALLIASRGQPENQLTWVIIMCSGFILFSLYGITTVLLQILKTLEKQKAETNKEEAAG